MKTLKLSMILLFAFTAGMAQAANSASKEAELLLDSMDMENLMTRSIEQNIEIQLQQNPKLKPFRQIMIDFLNKYMSYKTLKADLVKLYADAFTAKELREINAFYKTKTGQKTIRLLPELMGKAGQLGASKVQAHKEELQQKLQAESERLKKEQEK